MAWSGFSLQGLVLFGTELGNSEEIAKLVHGDINGLFTGDGKGNVSFALKAMNQVVQPSELVAAKLVVLITSTTGNGDPPTNAVKFFKMLRDLHEVAGVEKTLPLAGVQFCVLGNGDSNYSRYNAPGKALQTMMSEMGAVSFLPITLSDNASDIEPVVEEWRRKLKQAVSAVVSSLALENTVSVSTKVEPTVTKPPKVNPVELSYSKLLVSDEGAFWKKFSVNPRLQFLNTLNDAECGTVSEKPIMIGVKSAKWLTNGDPTRRVLHMEFKLPNGLSLIPGDALAIYCPNVESEVNELCDRLKVGTDAFQFVKTTTRPCPHIPDHCTPKQAFLFHVDIRMTNNPVRKSLLKALAEFTSDEGEKAELLSWTSRDGSELYKSNILVAKATLLSLLKRFKSCMPPLEILLHELPALQHRFYSCSNAAKIHPQEAHVAFSVVDLGLCTNWLVDVCTLSGFIDGKSPSKVGTYYDAESDMFWIPSFIKRSKDFCPPLDTSSPLIMIGPGTGVTPFLGFVQDRFDSNRGSLDNVTTCDEKGKLSITTQHANIGTSILFFGCRNRQTDFLYFNEFSELIKNGALKEMHNAFSRETSEKIYVQALMKEHGKILADLVVNQSAKIFVCGYNCTLEFSFICRDGSKMAGDVLKCFVELLSTHNNMSMEDSQKFFKTMMENKSYVVDIW